MGETTAERFSTADAPPGEGLAHWRAMIDRYFVPVEVAPVGDRSAFVGSATVRRMGELQVARVRARAMTAVHTRRHIDRSRDDDYLLALQLSAITHAAQDGRRVTLRAGDLALFDSTRPYAFHFHTASAFGHVIVRIPRPALDARGAGLGLATAIAVPYHSAEGRLLSPYLNTLSTLQTLPSTHSIQSLSATALDLIATALGSVALPGSRARRGPQTALARAKRETLARLGDPDLSAADVAAASFVSVRQLHRIFAVAGLTFGGFVRESRLGRCREDLADPRLARRPIAEISARHGCRSAAHFTRSFKARYGMTPRQFRAQVLTPSARRDGSADGAR